MSPVLRALIVLFAVPFTLAGEAWAFAENQPPWLIAIDLAAAASFFGSGILAWSRRPDSWIGPLLVIAGCSWVIGGFDYWGDVGLTLSLLFSGTHLFILPWVVLGYPSGRLTRTVDRAWVGLAAVLVIAYELTYAFTVPGSLLAGEGNVAVVESLLWLSPRTGYIYGLTFSLYLLVRFARATPAARRVYGPPWLAYVVYLLLPGQILAALLEIEPPQAYLFWAIGYVAIALVPVTLAIGLISTEPSRAAAGRLAAEVGTASAPGLRDALARALGDPTLEVIRADASGGFGDLVEDSTGGPTAPAGRSVTLVESNGARLAALVHDSALRAEPEVVAAVVSVARLALENERLRERLAAQLDEVEASRLRIVEATDAERRRIERDIHDGAQQSLVSALLGLQLTRGTLDGDAASAETTDGLDRTKRHLEDALRELRELAHGIHPAVLTESGLPAALESLAERSAVPTTVSADLPERLPDSVEEAAYFVAAEAMTNAAKHARAGAVRIEARLDDGRLALRVADDGAGGARPDGSGMRGMGDRIAALGGTLTITSPSGGGTTIEASIPCG